MAGVARKALEERTGKPVITEKNAVQLNAVVTGMIEATASFISTRWNRKRMNNRSFFPSAWLRRNSAEPGFLLPK